MKREITRGVKRKTTSDRAAATETSFDPEQQKPSRIECPVLRELWQYLSGVTDETGGNSAERRVMLRTLRDCVADPDLGMSPYWASLPEATAQALATATGNGVVIVPILVYRRLTCE